MTDEFPTFPHDDLPEDDMPTVEHGDHPGEEPPSIQRPAQPVEPVQPVQPVEPVEPAEDIPVLESPQALSEEAAEATSGLNIGLIAVAAGGAAVVLIGLVLAALFLPPLNLAATLRGCQPLDSGNPSLLRDDGLTAKWVGPDALKLCINSVSAQDFQNGKGGDQFQGALQALPSYLQLKSPVYTVEKIGSSAASLEITLSADAQPYSNIDLYRWDSKNKQWVFVPGHVDPSAGVISTDAMPDNVAAFETQAVTPLLGATLDANDAFDPNTGSALNLILPTGATLGSDHSLGGSVIGGWQLGAGYAVVPVVSATDPASLSSLLNSPADLALHVEDLKSFTVSNGYNGVALNYQGVSPDDRAAFTKFVQALATALHGYDKLLIVMLPAPSGSPGSYDTTGYDWRAIGDAADAVVLSPGDNPDDYAVNGNALALLSWATGEVSRLKIYMAIPTQSAQDSGGTISPISYEDALAPLGKTKLDSAPDKGRDYFTPGTNLSFSLDGSVGDLTADQNTGAFRYTTSDASGQRKVWIVTASTIRARLDMANAQHVGGMVLTGLMSPGNDGGLPTVVNEFKAAQTSSVPSGLMVNWTVSGSAGAVLNQTVGIGTPLAWQANPTGQYTVNAAIVGGRSVDRGNVGLQVAEVPTPTPTPRPVVIAPRPAPSTSSSAPPPPAPVAGGGGGGGPIELGGQVPGSIAHAAYMHQAGMKWVKYQAPYTVIDAGTAAAYVNEGHSNGFKVLLSMPGQHYPSSINFSGYVSFVGQVAASAHPDAIEVWNEMNIKNEWPVGQIDPNAYVSQMLAPAFNAIKSASPSTMVIMGALAPTGFDNGTDAWTDQRYAQGLAAAGAAKYADCMGVHHNSGTTAPNVSSGRPEGDHWSWYFLPTINVEHDAMGDALPVCLTEFGYLTPEGYGPLSSAFAWGANTTIADQAAWLAQGYQIAQGLGFVRLVIVWNVDYTYYSDDPQAGYAIVRADGSCPACQSLGAVAH